MSREMTFTRNQNEWERLRHFGPECRCLWERWSGAESIHDRSTGSLVALEFASRGLVLTVSMENTIEKEKDQEGIDWSLEEV